MNSSSSSTNLSGGYLINSIPPKPVISITPSPASYHQIYCGGQNLWDQVDSKKETIFPQLNSKKCDEIGCKDGKVLLLHSTVDCKKCNGRGVL